MKTRLQVPLFTILLTLMSFTFSADGWGQTVIINFDDASKWTAGSFAIGSYASDHTYIDENWTFTGGPALRNGAAAQDGFPGALGTYSWRLRDAAGVVWTGTYNQANTIEAFGFAVRRWDGTPDPEFTIEYSTNSGVNFSNTGVVISNAYLNNSSDWKLFSFTLPAPVVVTSGEFVVKVTRVTGERIMIDDFSFTISTSNPILSADTSVISNLNYNEGFGPSAPQSFDISGQNLDPASGNISVTAPANFEISTDNISFANAVNLPYTGGTLSATPVHVRLVAGLAHGSYLGDVIISGGNAPAAEVSLAGTVIEPFDLPYFNGLRNQADWDQATANGFDFNSTSFSTGAGGYVQVPLNASIVTPAIDFGDYNLIVASFDLTTFGGNTSQELTVFVSNDNGVIYTALNTFIVPASYQTFTQIIDVSALFGTNGRIKFEMTGGTNSTRFRDLNLKSYDYYYDMATWTPANPSGISTATDNIWVASGEATFTADTEVNNLDIATGAKLNIEEVLKINGDINNDGELVFVSNATTTAQLDEVPLTSLISGDVTIQRYIPAGRAFRFLSSAVTTFGTIRANWQEGVNNPDILTNLDPNPGFGTHITGSTVGANGFDATPGGNPSLFTLNNTTQAWEDVTNTDVNTITAGKAYRMLVRGDRSIDVTDNSAVATNTTLRTTGTLYTGSFTATDLSQVANEFNFFGNPYPAAVDMNQVLSVSTNVNPSFYYIWDPNLGTRGAYVTVQLPAGTNASSSDGNQFLQPGQAAFVTTVANGPASLQFEEAHKNVAAPQTAVFSVESNIDLRLFTANAYANSDKPADGLRLHFGDDLTNALTSMDAPKFFNDDENLASSNDSRLWSLESRFLPQVGEVLPLFTNQYRTTDYVFEAEVSTLVGVTAYLKDTFTGDEVVLTNDDISIYTFSIDTGNPLSSASDRFEIIFDEEGLSTDDNVFGNDFVLYPNPVKNDNFFIATRGLEGEMVTVEIYSMLGQLFIAATPEVAANGRVTMAVPQLPTGVFTVTLTAKDGSRYTTKLINQ